MSIDIVLTSIASRMDNHYRPPLSLMYVAQYYRSRGMLVHIIDFPFKNVIRNKEFWRTREVQIENTRKKILREIGIHKPKLVGISCYSPELEEVKSLINAIHRVSPSKIVVGGVHPTLKPTDFDGIVDYCIQGRLDEGFPAYDLIDMEYYTHANPYAIRGVFLRCAYVLASFGCPSQCTFCVSKQLMKHFRTIQLKTPEALYKEVKHLKDTYFIDGFYLIDDLYTTDKKKVIEFCNLIKKERLLWGCSSKVTFVDEEMIETMAGAGCIQIDFGIERGSDEALKKIKKGINIRQVKEAISLCKHYGIRVFANFLVGLPEEVQKDRRDIESLISETRPEIVSINRFTPYFGTELQKRGAKENNSVEIMEFINKAMKRYNSLWTNLKFHLSWRYISTILRSKRRLDYWRQLWLILKEIKNQKY